MDKIKEAIDWCDEKLKYAENPTTVNELKQYLEENYRLNNRADFFAENGY